ncbi:MAG: DUF192 domain-containing protein [Bacteroidetes bacterium]|nr:DUF192 domain-containing protein [Bacteroidota bacterium]
MKKIMRSIAAMCLALALVSCGGKKEEKILTRSIEFNKEGELTLTRIPTDSLIVTLDIEIAEDNYATQTGLMYRTSMENHQAMLFIFPKESPLSFHMKNTQFPLDLIFLNEDLKIVNVHRDAQPYDQTPLSSGKPAKYVLEVNAGLVAQWKLLPIDQAAFNRLPIE